jgi:hypothetical protein
MKVKLPYIASSSRNVRNTKQFVINTDLSIKSEGYVPITATQTLEE